MELSSPKIKKFQREFSELKNKKTCSKIIIICKEMELSSTRKINKTFLYMLEIT